jgi:BirA family biotin operon repressor/biotin-[acetyl-CoA-carboxylase] ligase
MDAAGPDEAAFPGFRILPPLWLDTVTSTNDAARVLASDGAAGGTVVAARRQTAGRGRHDHAWVSGEGGLYASVVLRSGIRNATRLSAASGEWVARALESLGPVRLQAVVPNDLFAGGKKIAGVLVERTFSAGRPAFAVVGFGVNVAQPSFPEGLAATTLAREGIAATPETVLDAVLREMAKGDLYAASAAWQRRCAR